MSPQDRTFLGLWLMAGLFFAMTVAHRGVEIRVKVEVSGGIGLVVAGERR